MSAQRKYITQPEFESALTAFSGYVDHSINMAKGELRREIVASEDRIIAKITELTAPSNQETGTNEVSAKLATKADLEAVKAELKAEIQEIRERQDRIESVGKANHQMLQLMLEQFSKVNKKLGID